MADPGNSSGRYGTSLSSNQSYYELLGLTIEASKAEISSSYRQKALKVHPDKNQSPEAAVLFQQLNTAYMVLSDDTARAAYDRLERIKIERKKKDEAMDSRRRGMKEALLERERLAKAQKDLENKAKMEFEEQLNRLKKEMGQKGAFHKRQAEFKETDEGLNGDFMDQNQGNLDRESSCSKQWVSYDQRMEILRRQKKLGFEAYEAATLKRLIDKHRVLSGNQQ